MPNTELAKKPKDSLEYVVVHEMVHLKKRNHSDAFVKILNQYLPTWRESRLVLNELSLGV